MASETATPAQVLTRLFTEDVDPGWFDQHGRDTGFVERVATLRDGYLDTLGSLQGVRADEGFWLLEFADQAVPTYLSLDADGAINGLWFNLSEPLRPLTLAEIESVVPEFSGEISLLVEREGEVLFSHNAAQPLAVGSAFKLAVLRALRQETASGRLDTDASVVLQSHHKSLPSGTLQNESAGSPWTLDDLAVRMIAESDNTATDLLIDTVGAEAVEAVAERNQPLLTTAAFFKLKDPAQAALLARWRKGDTATKRAVIEALGAVPLPPVSIFDGGPLALDVEWFFTPRELCELLKALHFDPALIQNTAQLDAARWRQIAYKGGSEPGVINQSMLLESHTGKRSCVVGTWNAPEGMVTLPFIRLVSHLARLANDTP